MELKGKISPRALQLLSEPDGAQRLLRAITDAKRKAGAHGPLQVIKIEESDLDSASSLQTANSASED